MAKSCSAGTVSRQNATGFHETDENHSISGYRLLGRKGISVQEGVVLTVASPKGGVGKTTLSLNLGLAMARRGWRTLVADADPQGGIALSVSDQLRALPGLVDVLAGRTDLDDALVKTRVESFKLLPLGRLPATEIDAWSPGLSDGKAFGRFCTAARDAFDLVILDTAPSLAGASLGALRAADFVLVPLQAEPLAARAVSQLLEIVASLRKSGAGPRLAGLVLSMLQSRNDVSLEVAQESWRLFPRDLVLDATIPRDDAFLRASAAGVPVALLRKQPPAAAAVFDHLAAELELRLELVSEEDPGDALSLLG